MAQATVGDNIPRQVGLGCIRKSKQCSSVVSASNSCLDFLHQKLMMAYNLKDETNPFPSNCFWSWFITATKSKLEQPLFLYICLGKLNKEEHVHCVGGGAHKHVGPADSAAPPGPHSQPVSIPLPPSLDWSSQRQHWKIQLFSFFLLPTLTQTFLLSYVLWRREQSRFVYKNMGKAGQTESQNNWN